MKRMRNKFLALLVVLAVLALCFTPAAAWAVDIDGQTTAAGIQSIIQGEITALGAGGGTVTVTGTADISVDDPDKSISLSIPDNVTVVWQANLTGSTSGSSGNWVYLISLTRPGLTGGTFEVVTGGSVVQNGTDRAINGYCNVTVSGGVISATTNRAISVSGNVTVRDGVVSNAHTANAINATNVTVAGGLVFSYGNAIHGTSPTNNVISSVTYSLTEPGVVVAWNNKATPISYTAGTRTDLTVDPANGAAWGIIGGVGGIVYDGKVFPIPGVSVTSGSGDNNNNNNNNTSDDDDLFGCGNIGFGALALILLGAGLLATRKKR